MFYIIYIHIKKCIIYIFLFIYIKHLYNVLYTLNVIYNLI